MTTSDQDRALERLSLEHDGAPLQVQLADTAGAVLVTALDDSGAVYELADDGSRSLRRSNGPRYTARDEHDQPHLFNAPRTMRGQIALGGIE